MEKIQVMRSEEKRNCNRNIDNNIQRQSRGCKELLFWMPIQQMNYQVADKEPHSAALCNHPNINQKLGVCIEILHLALNNNRRFALAIVSLRGSAASSKTLNI